LQKISWMPLSLNLFVEEVNKSACGKPIMRLEGMLICAGLPLLMVVVVKTELLL
jgi:hypothetical protein